ncbi:probable ubiquitin carboxyl-terminal hydrolase MINDY-4 isoform X1 [Chionomys nivalis]|uniref:probable ubiquitin carboxyl-terminal hydrolase MINDY-4 isoform X1 n=1 Tax=Chionomys nivalis TaxID=269649 RepID=UPI0025922D36|nr:probable ubiquitin carboxyl-terminal hydrolase MINDY-4 isoform X1 [Chionomys nivalis]
MDSLYVEEVAASLVREFLSRKGLKKTFVTMDQERPRCELSINSRNDLRKVLHLEFLYRENKAKEKPLKTNLELITRYFLAHSGNTDNLNQEDLIPALPVPKKNNKLSSRCSETTLVNIYDLSDEDTGRRMSWSETGKARHDNHDGDILGNFISPKKSPHKSKPAYTVLGDSLPLVSAWEKVEQLHSSEPCTDVKRSAERTRPKSGLIVRGMMAGPVASSPQDSFRKRSLRRSSSLNRKLHAPEESQQPSEALVHTPACPGPQEVPTPSSDSMSRSPLGQLNELPVEKPNATSSSQELSQRNRPRPRSVSEDGPSGYSHTETSTTPSKLYLPDGNSRMTQEQLKRMFKRQGSQPPSLRKNQLVSDKAGDKPDALWLEDVEDELIKEDIVLTPPPSMLKLQTVSKPIDLSLAKEMKTLLFGSTFCCFSEEWKLQNFSFSDTASLKYGIVQNKGGPCGVLAAVQGCVLQKLLFEGDSRTNCNLQLRPSDAQRTHCLALAIADILWRAGGREQAVVALPSGTPHFSPAGKYKADGVLETLTLYSLTRTEDLVTFLQQSIHQFEVGPYGCILLTLSAILSRSLELVRQDFDVPTSHLIGAHGYCTQELVNLLLTGRAVSNVFNDVVELDSGDGNTTLLRGIEARSDIGFLSLFEHYNVCQVGCFLKTPRFPIWVVCSESHFSTLFSLQPELLSDWRAERLFDLYYYDGLANQQEEIRLTVDTTKTTPEDSCRDLVPPLELCIRTNKVLLSAAFAPDQDGRAGFLVSDFKTSHRSSSVPMGLL